MVNPVDMSENSKFALPVSSDGEANVLSMIYRFFKKLDICNGVLLGCFVQSSCQFSGISGVKKMKWLNRILLQVWPNVNHYARTILKESIEPAVAESLANYKSTECCV
ncbi:unnamed protein product [Leptidea sinapis]|uniref:Uncharacterized protein n=1 Tax=Leptidea sinapis TaxID=189913 RepID=A0A5E4QH70_9NEOP|nr:unnamed protein product [Leptidea sinapis]